MRYFRLFSFRGHQNLNTLIFERGTFYRINDVNEAAEWLEGILFRRYDSAFPTKQVMMSDKDPYWMTPRNKGLINQKKQFKSGNNFKIIQELDREKQWN